MQQQLELELVMPISLSAPTPNMLRPRSFLVKGLYLFLFCLLEILMIGMLLMTFLFFVLKFESYIYYGLSCDITGFAR